jgi:phosphatidylinositol alpha-1,6-mannosyltransferase
MHQAVSAETGWNWVVVARKDHGSSEWDRQQKFSTHRVTLRPELRLLDRLWLKLTTPENRVDRLVARQMYALARRTVSGGRVQIVLADQLITALAAQRAALGACPFAVFAHGKELLRPTSLQLEALRSADLVIANSQWTAARSVASGANADKVHVLHPCGGCERFSAGDRRRGRVFLGVPETSRVLLTVASLVKRKGHDLVLGILAELRRRHGDIRYVIVGSGPEESALRTLAADHGVADAVVFAGAISDEQLPDIYAASDVFVMPSRETETDVEGFGIVYVEAAFAGLPVVGSRTGGIPDAVEDGKSGFLVQPGDEAGLAQALTRLLPEPPFAKTMGGYGRQRTQRLFSTEAFARQLGMILAAAHGHSRQ